jgi:hypothetical protein
MEEKKEKKSISIVALIVITLILITISSVGAFKLGKYYANKEQQLIEEKETNKNNSSKEDNKETNKEEDQKENINDETNDENNNSGNTDKQIKIVGQKYEEFDNIIKNLSKEKDLKSAEGYESFYMNRIHAEQPGAWGDGLPEMYYFDEDGTYLLNISEYDVSNDKVLRAGTWEIKNDTLILKEKYVLCLVNGTLTDVSIPGGTIGKGFVDYDFEVKESKQEHTFTIKHIGTSTYKEDMSEETNGNVIPDNYTLNGKDRYSLENYRYTEDLGYANLYLNLLK